MKRFFYITAFSFIITACSIQSPAYYSSINDTPSETITTKQVGEMVLFQQEGFLCPSIKITKGSKTTTTTVKEGADQGEVYTLYEIVGNKEYYYPPQSITRDGVFAKKCIVINRKTKKSQFRYNDGLGWLTHEFASKIEYTEAEAQPDKTKPFFRKDFMYNGRVGNSLKFTYREFVNDLARPAFTQDLQYDLTESDIIGFRDARIKITDATNTSLKYKVLKGLSQ